MAAARTLRIALIEAGSPGLNIYSGVAMGRGIPISRHRRARRRL